MTDKKRFFYNGILLTAVGVTMRTVALFFNAYVTSSVGAEGIGLYTLVMTVYNFGVTFAASGISLTVTRLVASALGEGREGSVSHILRGALIYSLIFSSLATAALLLFSGGISSVVLSDERAAACLRILAPSLIPVSLISALSGYFVGVKKVACNAITQICGQLFRMIITIAMINSLVRGNIEQAAVVLSLGTTLTELISLLIITAEFLIERRRHPHSPGADVSSVFEMAMPLSLSAYVRQALLTIEHILIPKRLEHRGESHTQALSSYGTLHGMALPMILYPMATLTSFSGLLVPEFAERGSKGDKSGMSRICARAFGATLVYAVATCVLLFVFSEELGYVVYDSYQAGHYIAVLAPVIPLMYLDHVTDSILKGIGEHVYSMWINILDSLLSVVLVYILIPHMGIMGYAVCIIVMEAFNFTMSALRLRKRIRIRLDLIRTVLIPAMAAFASAVLSKEIFISAGAQTSPLWLTLEIVFSACIFFAAYKSLDMLYERKNLKCR